MVESVTLGAGALVGLADCTVYLMNPRGGIDAVAIDKGNPRWQTTMGSQPLLLQQNHLIALEEPTDPHSLTIVTLDSANGQLVNSGRLALPDDVRASIDNGPGSSFAVQAEPNAQGMRIKWKYVHRVLRGQVTAAGSPPPLTREGTALFEPSSGKIRSFATAQSPPPSAEHDVQRAGDFLVRLQPSNTNSTTIKRWRGRDRIALPPVEIPAPSTAIAVSTDGRFARAIVGQVPVAQGLTDYQWRIYSLADGRPSGDLQLPVRTSPFLVCEGTLLYEAPPIRKRVGNEWISQPLRMVAVNLGSHSELWSHPVRDTTFRGPLPPSPR